MSRPEIRDEFAIKEGDNKTRLTWRRWSPDVPGAEITASVEIVGLDQARRMTYAIEIREEWASIEGWGGGAY